MQIDSESQVELDDTPVEEHVAHFEAIHQELAARLSAPVSVPMPSTDSIQVEA